MSLASRNWFNYLVDERDSKRIVFINGDMNQNDGIERATAFRQAMIRHNLLIDEALMLQGDFIPEVAAESTRAFLNKGLAFDVLAAADLLNGNRCDANTTGRRHQNT